MISLTCEVQEIEQAFSFVHIGGKWCCHQWECYHKKARLVKPGFFFCLLLLQWF